MALSGTNDTSTGEIITGLVSSNFKAYLFLEYYDTSTSSWIRLDDLDVDQGVDWSNGGKVLKYANFILTPQASTVSFRVLNTLGKYSEGSGKDEDGKITIDTRIRLNAGYFVPTRLPAQTVNLDLGTTNNAYFLYTEIDSGYIALDSSNANSDGFKRFSDFFTFYDTVDYDSGTYTPAGYYTKLYDTKWAGNSEITEFSLTANNTKGTIYYRFFNNKTTKTTLVTDSTDWTSAGATVNGTKTTTVSSGGLRFMEIAVILDTTNWDEDLRITAISLEEESNIDYLYKDVFYLDSPSFNEPISGGNAFVNCNGRDVYKRAIETDINLQDLSSGTSVEQLLKDICDVIGVPYTSTSIGPIDSADFPDRLLATGLDGEEKAEKVFQKIMTILNKDGSPKYRMYLQYDDVLEDKALFVKQEPTEFALDQVFNPSNYIGIGDLKKNNDRRAKVVTVVTSKETVDEEEQLDTDNYTTTGTKSLTWVSAAINKRYTVTINSGDAVVVLADVSNTQLQFSITGTTIDVDITVWGQRYRSTTPTYIGEWIDHDNMINNEGQTATIENQLLSSDTEAKDTANGIITDFGDPTREARNIQYPYLNLLLQQNDIVLLQGNYLFLDDLYFITKINYHWDYSKNPKDNTSYDTQDSGIDFADVGVFKYDSIMDYDKGFRYDDAFNDLEDNKADYFNNYVYIENVDEV